MSLSGHVVRQLNAMRLAAPEAAGAETASALSVQRILVSLENLVLLSLKTSEVIATASAVRLAITRRGEQPHSVEGLQQALDDFEIALDLSGPNNLAETIGAWRAPAPNS